MSTDPYANLSKLAKFEFSSSSMQDGAQLPLSQVGSSHGGQGLSPQLSWQGFPAETKSFAITVFDPDAPVPGGFWHWAVYNIPASSTNLDEGAGNGKAPLPPGAVTLHNDRSSADYIGAAPPAGTGTHRYYFVVYALDIEKLDIPTNSTPTFLSFNLHQHAIAWASIVCTYEHQ
jgi:Raf kinase inhibitor-like YbhB/YbcL family protein